MSITHSTSDRDSVGRRIAGFDRPVVPVGRAYTRDPSAGLPRCGDRSAGTSPAVFSIKSRPSNERADHRQAPRVADGLGERQIRAMPAPPADSPGRLTSGRGTSSSKLSVLYRLLLPVRCGRRTAVTETRPVGSRRHSGHSWPASCSEPRSQAAAARGLRTDDVLSHVHNDPALPDTANVAACCIVLGHDRATPPSSPCASRTFNMRMTRPVRVLALTVIALVHLGAAC